MDWYRLWVWDNNDNGPRPRPKSPCGGTEPPVVFWIQPKVYPGITSVASLKESCERFAATEEVPYVVLKLHAVAVHVVWWGTFEFKPIKTQM